ncbi:hypothetical protein X769_22235 [Mesorhizobium sp. LSJC268A00]|nr:hypothetical protein X769_22235 [Mesorhizobium sp. LSJC268A00]
MATAQFALARLWANAPRPSNDDDNVVSAQDLWIKVRQLQRVDLLKRGAVDTKG